MRIWKLVVLLAGIVGVIGFFTPLIDYRTADGKLAGDASAFQIARGIDSSSDLGAQAEQLGLSQSDGERVAQALQAGIAGYDEAIIACFLPAGLLTALGVLLLLRDRMGRTSGLCAVMLGVACGAVFARFWLADQASQDPGASLGLGVYLLLAGGLGGAVAGLGAMVSPDHGSAR